MNKQLLIKLVSITIMLGMASMVQASLITNVATNGIASQSSSGTWAHVAGAWLANDGNTNMNYYGGASVAHTLFDSQPWWEVDLLSSHSLSQIVIWSRSDGGANWLTNFDVTVSDENHDLIWSQNYYGSGGHPYPTLTIDLPTGITGNFLKIQKLDPGYLMLAEVQIFGEEATAVPEPSALFLLGVGLMGLVYRKRK